MEFSKSAKENQKFFKSMYELDELAAKAGGYVEECYDFPSYDIRAAEKEAENLGRSLTKQEFEKYRIK